MNAKARIKRAESALSSSAGVKLVWVEPDEARAAPPLHPNQKVINLKWEIEPSDLENEKNSSENHFSREDKEK